MSSVIIKNHQQVERNYLLYSKANRQRVTNLGARIHTPNELRKKRILILQFPKASNQNQLSVVVKIPHLQETLIPVFSQTQPLKRLSIYEHTQRS